MSPQPKPLFERELEPDLLREMLHDPALPSLVRSDEERAGLQQSISQRLEEDNPMAFQSLPWPDDSLALDLVEPEAGKKAYYIPRWWPKQDEGGNTLPPRHRLLWFQAAVRQLLESDYDQLLNKREKQLRLLTTLPILRSYQATGSLNTPDLL